MELLLKQDQELAEIHRLLAEMKQTSAEMNRRAIAALFNAFNANSAAMERRS